MFVALSDAGPTMRLLTCTCLCRWQCGCPRLTRSRWRTSQTPSPSTCTLVARSRWQRVSLHQSRTTRPLVTVTSAAIVLYSHVHCRQCGSGVFPRGLRCVFTPLGSRAYFYPCVHHPRCEWKHACVLWLAASQLSLIPVRAVPAVGAGNRGDVPRLQVQLHRSTRGLLANRVQ